MAKFEQPTTGVMVLDGLLEPADLRVLVDVVDSATLADQRLGRAGDARTRRRGEVRSASVAALLWARLAPVLPAPVDWFTATDRPRLEPEIDRWRWDGCNEFTRCYEYGVGDEFRAHVDESWRAGAFRRSLLTVLVYLPPGERCEGGETVVDGHAIEPVAGRVAVFDHRLRHAGQPVLAGRKVVLRNDVIGSGR